MKEPQWSRTKCAVDPDFRPVGNAVEAQDHPMPRKILRNGHKAAFGMPTALPPPPPKPPPARRPSDISAPSSEKVLRKPDQKIPLGIGDGFPTPQHRYPGRLTPAVISGTGTMSGLGQTGFGTREPPWPTRLFQSWTQGWQPKLDGKTAVIIVPVIHIASSTFHAGKTPLIFNVTALALGGVAGNLTWRPFSS